MRSNRRDSLRRTLAAEGIQTGIHYPAPLHRQPGLRARASFAAVPSASELASAEVLSLPGGPHISEGDAEYIAERIRMRVR
jgi:dTDP-3-amino-3,4,6-trideoxy-alpha-D-glucose transaminase